MLRWLLPVCAFLSTVAAGCTQPQANAAAAPVINLDIPRGCAAADPHGSAGGLTLKDARRILAVTPCARLAPTQGAYYGVNLDWTTDTPAAYAERLGVAPAVYVQFLHFPLDAAGRRILTESARLAAGQHGMLLLTLEPWDGLDTVDDAAIATLAGELVAVTQQRVGVFVRFAHEMNGSWYPWSQQPEAYITTFRAMAKALHAASPHIAMLWAPNYGGGYPFRGGRYEARLGSSQFAQLDTNGDGHLNMNDDPYAPYYPGDDAVDWAGMSLYHWGTRHPWGENVEPTAGKFIQQLTGAYHGGSDDGALPDFYRHYGVLRGKPIAIAETAALFNTEHAGGDELAIKQAWWRQVFAQETLIAHPALRMLNWFEWRKPEVEVNGAIIDWGVSRAAVLRSAFAADLARLPLQFAPGPQ